VQGILSAQIVGPAKPWPPIKVRDRTNLYLGRLTALSPYWRNTLSERHVWMRSNQQNDLKKLVHLDSGSCSMLSFVDVSMPRSYIAAGHRSQLTRTAESGKWFNGCTFHNGRAKTRGKLDSAKMPNIMWLYSPTLYRQRYISNHSRRSKIEVRTRPMRL